MDQFPFYIDGVFYFATGLTLFFLYTSSRSKTLIMVVTILMLLQAVLALNGFYATFDQVPPGPVFLLLPSVVLLLMVFLTKRGKAWIDTFQLKQLTLLHIVRIPVELVLFWLCEEKLVSPYMTFEGWNYDIFSGISALLIYLVAFKQQQTKTRLLLLWNILCLLLLINIVTIAILALPTPFQQLSFKQPNLAVAFYPYVWLPGIIVPAVLFSHLVSIRALLKLTRKDELSQKLADRRGV